MKDMNMISSYQAHLLVQYPSSPELIDSEPHLIARAKQASCFLHWLSVVTLAVPLFPFNTPTKPLIRLHIKYTTVIHKL